MVYLTAEEVIEKAEHRGMPRVLIVTALSEEIRGVLAHVSSWGAVRGRQGIIYECGEFNGKARDWLVVVASSGPGNQPAQTITMLGHGDFGSFDCVMFVGVAGSRKKDVPIGSVIAANRVYNPYSGKDDAQGFTARPHGYNFPLELVQLAMKVERDDLWQARIKPARHGLPLNHENYPQPFPPAAFVGPIASVEAVMANPKGQLERLLARHYSDAQGVEMEGLGTAAGAEALSTPAIVIRGVSDMTMAKMPETDRYLQPIAVTHACAFAFEMLNLWSPERLDGVPRRAPETLPPTDAGHTRPDHGADIPGLSEAQEEEHDKGRRSESVRAPRPGQDAGAPLLGALDEPSYHALPQLTGELERASHDLLSWPQVLPDGVRLERPEFHRLLATVAETEGGTTVILGGPGAGKSALLAGFAHAVAGMGWPVLGIKADVLDPGIVDERGLQAQLGLTDPPSHVISQLAAFAPVALVIDQLDALASFVDVKTGRLNVLLNLIRRFGRTRNVHIVLSARTFEFEHDVRLRSIEAKSVRLDLPPWGDVQPVLAAHGLYAEGWPKEAQETLRTPQALATFLRLMQQGVREPFQTYQAMLEQVWNDRVLRAPNGERLARLATDIAEAMAARETLWIPAANYDDHAKDLVALEALDVLRRSGGAIGFTHQTLYDYVLARSFARGVGRLSAYVEGREASLFLRPKLWSALIYLRDVESGTYADELAAIWKLPTLRPHLRLLLIELIGMQAAPLPIEQELLLPLIQTREDRSVAVRAVEGSPGWFDILRRSEIPRLMTEDEDPSWIAARVLERAWRFAPDVVLELVQIHWSHTSAYDAQLWTVLGEAPTWDDPHTQLAETVLRRTDVNQWRVEHTISQLGVEQPAQALRLARARLDRELQKALDAATERAMNAPRSPEDALENYAWRVEHSPSKPLENLLDTNQTWDILASLAETAPLNFLEALWPWFVDALKALALLKPASDDRPCYPLRWSLDFRFDDEEGGLPLPETNILAGFRVAAEGAAKHPEWFRTWVRQNLTIELHPVQRLIAHALATNGETYANDAFAFLTEDTRRFYLGGYADQSGTTKDLIRAASPFWDQRTIDSFVRKVRSYRSPSLLPDDPESRRIRFSALRKLKLGLLKALADQSIDEEVKGFIRQEMRVFPDDVIGMRAHGAGFVDTPMSTDAMSKASNADIVNAFREIPDSTGWHHPKDWLQGGSIQLSRAFAEFAKLQPKRAAAIIGEFEPGIGGRAAGYALNAMAEAADPDLVLAVFCDAIRRGFQETGEFRDMAAGAIQRLTDREVPIGDDILDALISWLKPLSANEPPKMEEKDEELTVEAGRKDQGNNEFRSVLWDSLHFTTLPDGNYPILAAITCVLLRRTEHDRLLEIWEDHLQKPEEPDVWQALLRFMRFMAPTDLDARGRLIRAIFERYPSVARSREAAHLMAYAHWWANEDVRQILESWRTSDDAWRRQAFGELVGLVALVQPALAWPQALLAEILEPNSMVEEKAGAAFAAINLWNDLRFRSAANRILLAFIPQADPKLWAVIFDLFRLLDELGPDAETVALLQAIAGHAHASGRQTMTFVVERLQTLLPHEALTVGRIAETLVANLGEELADIRTSSASLAPELVDLAITLHRFGGETRELGTRLFEELLRIDAYTARSTLDEIDNRLRNQAASPRRPRLQRRKKQRRGR